MVVCYRNNHIFYCNFLWYSYRLIFDSNKKHSNIFEPNENPNKCVRVRVYFIFPFCFESISPVIGLYSELVGQNSIYDSFWRPNREKEKQNMKKDGMIVTIPISWKGKKNFGVQTAEKRKKLYRNVKKKIFTHIRFESHSHSTIIFMMEKNESNQNWKSRNILPNKMNRIAK